ncbi:MAG: GGDEF domain-containing protein [Rhodospirillales bacterium]|nr:GGDEF domain-containing protein [Rhodospirillales bacterium]
MAEKPPELEFHESISDIYEIAAGLPDAVRDKLLAAAGKVEHAFAEAREEKRQLKTLALTDPLTRLPNRAGMMYDLNGRLESMKRYGDMALTVVMVDLDWFKAVNDKCGHVAGDDALRQVGKRLQEAFRGTDTVCRYGGDEMMLLLAHGKDEILDENRVRQKIRQALNGPPPLVFWDKDSTPHPVGASIGFSHLQGESICAEDDLIQLAETMIEEADANMYLDKAQKDARYKVAVANALNVAQNPQKPSVPQA